MDGKQNAIFFIGVILMIMVFWINGYWSILKNGITAPASASKSSPDETSPTNGKCPEGYTLFLGKCLKPINLQTPQVS